MFRSYEGRTAIKGQRVRVYRNLHRNCYTIQDRASGLVLGHSETVYLTRVRFVVNEGGRQRVLKTRQKNVHAFADGILYSCADARHVVGWGGRFRQASYNPYKAPKFVDRETGAYLDGEYPAVYLSEKEVRYTPPY
jgi:hypothetical protein